jgi:Rho GDP-dissociation inhibitor
MMGSYGPSNDVVNWKSPQMLAPSGLLARATYKVKTDFICDDKVKHLELNYSLKIAKDFDGKDE